MPKNLLPSVCRRCVVQVDDHTKEVVDCVFLCDVEECEHLEVNEESDNPNALKELEVVIRTTEDGYSAGRSYIYKTNRQDALDWEKAIDHAVVVAKRQQHKLQMQEDYGHSRVAMRRALCRQFLADIRVQSFIATIIGLAFLVDMLEAQYLPERGSETELFFFAFDAFATFFFTVELTLNMFAFSENGLRDFYSKASRVFDTAIVIVSITSVATYILNMTDVGYIKMLRLIRLFRVLRSSRMFYSASA